ncbi:transposase, partial [Serpentinicella sp. ANB-PHB4]|uniref:transposase n=1 Tax=Serpentinicella sp. ANB-PHB4 TaxID=3074076 RepID=UPI0028554C60
MYIRQMTLISFEQIMEFQQETKLEMILSQIDVSKLSSSLRKSADSKGPKGYDVAPLLYSLIAMQVEKIQTIKDLVSNLKQNPVLRYCCGFNVLGQVPSESTFSRFFERLTQNKELESLF